jgi:hypothetical protein
MKHPKMTLTGGTRQWAARVALFAVVLNSFAPAVTAQLAYMSGRAVVVTEHCLTLAASGDEQRPAGSLPSDDKSKKVSCPFCFAHAGSFGLTPVVVAPPFAVVVSNSVVSVVVTTVSPEVQWVTPQPRGPPVLS